MDLRIGKGYPCVVEYGSGEPEAVKIAAKNLKTDLVKVFGACVLSSERTDRVRIRIRTLELPQASGGTQQTELSWTVSEGVQQSELPWTASEGVQQSELPWTASEGVQQSELSRTASEGTQSLEMLRAQPEGMVTDGKVSEECYRGLCDENGCWRKEAYSLCVQDGILYITGTDRRGTIYGIYDLCERIGVSPWYFWADVPVKKKEEYILPEGYRYSDYPSVEYRGIFINDEEELEAWARSHMGEESIGVRTYEKVFELLLRLKGNYIWPAMHVNSFNVKRENGALAEKMGIVVGTSHCDMLMRSNNREWRPWLAKKGYEGVKYDYSLPGRNREILQEYWRESVEQNREFEVCYTLGMRGIHDSGFETEGLKGLSGEELKAAKIQLLQQVMTDQQRILRETLGRESMMTFIPYKEVLPLYDGGLEVPEDITLVWANDNYGYIRRYPSEKEKNRKGGNGIYYHNSYWAPPGMSYVFLCSIPLAHTANELRKAYAEGVRKLWVINTGAMKPLEQEIEFFLRLGWEIGKEGGTSKGCLTDHVDSYVEDWIDRNFSGGIGRETAKLLNDFSQLTNVRKLEMMDYDAFSQAAYGDEAVVRIHAYEELFEQGNRIYAGLPEEEKAAFFQLVLMRIHAAYFTNLAYYYGDRSTLMYRQGKLPAAEVYTRKVRELEDARRRMLIYYNKIMLDGKWDHILDPEGFPPPRAAMMPVCTPPLCVGDTGMVVTLWNEDKPIYGGRPTEGGSAAASGQLTFTRQAVKWLEIGNTGRGSVAFVLDAPEWLHLSQGCGTVQTECRILVWPEDTYINRRGVITIAESRTGCHVEIPVHTIAVHGAMAKQGVGAGCDGKEEQVAGAGYDGKEEQVAGAGYDGKEEQGTGAGCDGKEEQGTGVGCDSKEEQVAGAGCDGKEEQGVGAGYDGKEEQVAGVGCDSKEERDVNVGYDVGDEQGISVGCGIREEQSIVAGCGVRQEQGIVAGCGVREKQSIGAGYGVEDDGMVAVEADWTQSPDFRKIERLGRGCGSLMEVCAAHSIGTGTSSSSEERSAEGVRKKTEHPLQYHVILISEGEFLLEIHRFPSLNSTSQIRIGVSVDEGPVEIADTEATDEHKGTWRENVRNNVDRLYLKLPYLTAGEHVISFHAIDKYFAFTRFVIYTKERRENNYAGVMGCQALPLEFDVEKFTESFYGRISLGPRAVEYACPEKEKDTLVAADLIKQDSAYGETVEPKWILQRGERIFSEREGYICIDCGAALAQSDYAYTTGALWEHCASESYGRSGIAMYIRRRDMDEFGEIHSLNYRFTCQSGEYTIWLLAKFGRKEESCFSAGVDGVELSREELYHGGCLWRYEAEQIYRYVPVGKAELAEGEHLLTFYAKAPGLRFDRICLCKEEQGMSALDKKIPPMDSAWRRFTDQGPLALCGRL